jgi:N-acetylglucosaminyl-diphospho-decaprenol L-rhamnosyltransferase
MEVATIIVNYRTAGATIEAAASAFSEIDALTDAVVVVVDNDSGDGSLERLQATFTEERWRGRVVAIGTGHNGGFGFGVNFGMKHVIAAHGQPRYFCILNPDSTLAPGALGKLLQFMADHPEAGLLGNVIQNARGDRLRGFRFPTFLSELESGASFGPLSRLLDGHKIIMNVVDSCEVDWVSGVSMLLRSEVFSSLDLFDERFFLYFEEIDLAFRIKQAGWKVYFVAEASVDHIGGLSTGMGDQTRRMPRYWFDSRRRYFVKHHGRLYAAACDAAWICGHALFKAKAQLVRRASIPKLGRDFIRYSLTNLLKPAPEAEQYLSRAEGLGASRSAG